MDDAISQWWTAFEKQAPRIGRLFSGQEEWDLPEWMHEYLGAIHPSLMWEFGPGVKRDGHRLVITPESRRDLRPLVREVLRRAPRLAGWEFYEYRLPESLEQAALAVEGRVGGDIRGLQVQVRRGEFNRVDLAYLGFSLDQDDEAKSAMAFIATETLLGEEMLDRWIGVIEVIAEPSEGSEPCHIAALLRQVEETIDQIKASLPDRPWHQIDLEQGVTWATLSGEPEEADDVPEQRDLFVAITPMPMLMQNALAGIPFDSARYSKFGERFCYLKIDGIDENEGSAFHDREEVENAIDAVLRPASMGCSVGGGTGRRYSYVELALCDLDRAWEQLRLVLRDGRLPTRTWLQFHDDDLRAQWRGLYDDTPPPPMVESGET